MLLTHSTASDALESIGIPMIFTSGSILISVMTLSSMPRSLSWAVTLFVLLLRRTTLQPLVSMSRYVLVLFPAFMIWGRWGRNPRIQRLIIYSSVALLLYLSGQFAMWGWVA